MIAVLGRHPNFGSNMVQGALLSRNIHVPRDRIRQAIGRVDPAGTVCPICISLQARYAIHLVFCQANEGMLVILHTSGAWCSC